MPLLRILALSTAGLAFALPQSQPCKSTAPVAFLNVRVLSMDSPVLTRRKAVLIRDGRIAAIDPRSLPSNTCRIEGRGRVLMPGLSDLHVHTSERELPLFVANGVTLIREMNGSPTHLTLRARIAAGSLLGPRMLVASPLLTGSPLRYRHRLITSPQDARAAAEEAKAAGYDYLKVYDGLSREEYDTLVAAGHRLGIPLDGHIPSDVGLEGVLASGQFIQHMDKIAFALSGDSRDTSKLRDLRRMFNGKRTWVTPTLASLRALDAARTVDYAARLEGPEMSYVDSSTLSFWKSLSGTRPSRPPSRFYLYLIEVLKTLRATDTRFLLGTDEGNPLMVAGFSVHDELETLVRDGGFSPYDALTTATRNAGVFLGDSTTGRIARGARADLVLVDGSPLEDLRVLRHPAGVMLRGVWLDRTALDRMLESARQ